MSRQAIDPNGEPDGIATEKVIGDLLYATNKSRNPV